MESFDLKGTMSLTANSEEAARCKVLVPEGCARGAAAGVTFQVHPKVEKKLWEADGVVTLKDAAKGFPVGRPVGILRWSLSSSDEVPTSAPTARQFC